MNTGGKDGDNANEGSGEAPLRLDETRVWLAEWLSRREDAPDSFSEEAIRRIHQVSGGDLERIERLAWQCLTDPARQWARGPEPRKMATRAVIAGGVVIGAIAAWMLLTPPPERPASRTQPLDLPEPARKPGTPASKPGPPAELRDVDTAPAPAPAADGTGTPEELPDGIRSADWLREEEGNQYVLQLIGAVETGTIRKFIERSGIPLRQLTLVKTRRNGGDWHVLLYGLYPDAETARDHRGRLTAWVREQNPWPRKLSDVLAETKSGAR